MQIQQLRYFLEVAKTKNITTAARNLFISQPSLSQQIINLEKELNIPLLIRHVKSVTLTEAGEQFALHATRIVNDMQQLTELMQRHNLLEEGTLRIGILFIGGYIHLFDMLKEFQEEFPGIDYELTIDGSVTLLNKVLDRSLHAALIISNEQQLEGYKDLYYKKLIDDHYVALVSKEHPLAKKEILNIEDLKEQPIIMPSKSSIFRPILEHQFTKSSITPKIICETSQTNLVHQLVSYNFGIGFCSRNIAKYSGSIARKLADQEMIAIPFFPTLDQDIYYITQKDLLDYPCLSAFTEYVDTYEF